MFGLHFQASQLWTYSKQPEGPLEVPLVTAVFLCDFTPLYNMAAESLDRASMARKFEFSNRQNPSRPWFPVDFGNWLARTALGTR